MYIIGNLKDGVSAILTGTNIDTVKNLYGAFARAARKLVQHADVPEASLKEQITIYDGVYQYPIDGDIFGSALVDFRPQGVSRWKDESVQKMPVQQWDLNKKYNFGGATVSFEFDDGIPLIDISSTRPTARVILDSMQLDDGWTAAGSASGLTEDGTIYYDSYQSLRFTLTGSSTGTLTKAITSVNLSTYRGVGVAFLALRIPDGATVSNLTSIALRIGSSSTAYDEITATQGFLGAFVAGKWLLVAFDTSTASTTGTPDFTAIDYVQVRFAHTATFTNMRVGALWISKPSPFELFYQTAAIFLGNTSGLRSNTVLSNEDQIVLNDAAYLLYEHECALAITLQTKQFETSKELRAILYGPEGTTNVGLYAEYRGDNPSQEIRTVGTYYEKI